MKDLTVGNPLRKILGFCLPIFFGSLFQQLYTLTDSIIVGKFLGVRAFAAVGSTAPLNLLVLGFALGVCAALCVPVAQHFGAGDVKALRQAEANGMYLVLLISLLSATVMSLLTRPILTLFQTPANIIEDACRYMVVAFVGAGPVLLFSLLIGYIRAVGDSRTALWYQVMAYVLNIGLDLLFIVVLKTGVEGAALATSLAQLLVFLLGVRTIRRRFPVLWLTRENLRPSLADLGKLSRLALPMGLQFSFTAVGSIVIQFAVNSLGSDAVAATAAVSKVQNLLLTPLDAAGISMVTFASQNYGAKRFDRVRKGIAQTLLVSMLFCLGIFAITLVAGPWLARLFLDRSQTAIHALIWQLLLYNAFFYIPLCFIYIYRNALQGLGSSHVVMSAGVLEAIGRTFVALLLVPSFGFAAVCFSGPTAWVLADLFLLPMYFYTVRKLENAIRPA